ncbi:hypothetical protein D3C72_1656040 [compost metagenome]
MQRAQQHAAEGAGQQRVAAVAFQFGAGVAQQVLEVGIQLRVARRLEQMGKQGQVFAGGALLIQIDDQHAVVAHAGKLVIGIARHQAGAHAAYLATPAVDLELRTTGQRQHQLVVIVGVFVGLVIQAQQARFEHCNDNSADVCWHFNQLYGPPSSLATSGCPAPAIRSSTSAPIAHQNG